MKEENIEEAILLGWSKFTYKKFKMIVMTQDELDKIIEESKS